MDNMLSDSRLGPPARRKLSAESRSPSWVGAGAWLLILGSFLYELAVGSRTFAPFEVVGVLAFFALAGWLGLRGSEAQKQVSLEGDHLYLSDSDGDLPVDLAQIESIDEIGNRWRRTRTLRLRLREPIGQGREFFFKVENLQYPRRRPQPFFTSRHEPHPLVAELRERVAEADPGH